MMKKIIEENKRTVQGHNMTVKNEKVSNVGKQK